MPNTTELIEDRALQINYFPYLNMVDTPEIELPELGVKVWNYDLKANDYIEDPAVKSQVDLIIRANVGRWHEVKGIGIISIGNVDWRPFTAEVFLKVSGKDEKTNLVNLVSNISIPAWRLRDSA